MSANLLSELYVTSCYQQNWIQGSCSVVNYVCTKSHITFTRSIQVSSPTYWNNSHTIMSYWLPTSSMCLHHNQIPAWTVMTAAIYIRILVDPTDKLESIFDPVILSSGICSPYKSRSTSEVLACQFLKNLLSNNMIKIPQNRNHFRHPWKGWPRLSPESHA